MPLDEPNEEKPRVYRNEGSGVDPLDLVGDDKADVSRMAEDEMAKGEPLMSTASTSSLPNGARTTASNQIINQPNGSNLSRNNRTAFNTVSPSSYFSVHPAHVLQLQSLSQQYYNGFWGNRFPFVSPHAPSLSSPSMGSPTYGSTLNGVYPSPSTSTWLSQFPFDASKTGFYAPLVMGLPASISPNFASPMEQFQIGMAAAALSGSPFFHPSPLQSPDTGTPIAPIGSKVPHSSSATSLKLNFNNGISSSAHGYRLSPSCTQSSLGANPLLSIGRLVVPPATTSVTNVANNLAASATTKHRNNENGDKNDGSSLKRTSADDVSRYKNNTGGTSSSVKQSKEMNKKQHIKKPLNAFMLYMKEMRPKVMQEAGLKERQSAEINRILGRRWHSLSRDEQQKYYDMARKVRQEHLQKYPGWSARDNYAIHKKKKRKRDKTQDGTDNLEAKKCRARFGLDQQMKWCKHCRRKKKCLWFKDGDNDSADAAEASPPAQVTSTTQFVAVVDPTCGGTSSSKPESARQPVGSNKEQNVSSPHSLVTSTTTGQRNGTVEDSDDDLIESCSDLDDIDGSDDDDDDDDDLLDPKRLKLVTDIDEVKQETCVVDNHTNLLCNPTKTVLTT